MALKPNEVQFIVDAVKQAAAEGRTIPAESATAVSKGQGSTVQRNAVEAFANSMTPGWRTRAGFAGKSNAAQTKYYAQGLALAIVLAGSITAVAMKTADIRGEVYEKDSIADAIFEHSVGSRGEKVMNMATQNVNMKLDGVGYRFVAGEINASIIPVCPAAKAAGAWLEGSGSGAMDPALDIAMMASTVFTGRDGASSAMRLSEPLSSSELGLTDTVEVDTLGLFLLPNRLRTAARLTSLQVQVPPEVYSACAGGTAEVWIDGDLIYEDIDAVSFVRSLQGDATDASLNLDIVVSAHSKVEVLMELGSPLILNADNPYIPPLAGNIQCRPL